MENLGLYVAIAIAPSLGWLCGGILYAQKSSARIPFALGYELASIAYAALCARFFDLSYGVAILFFVSANVGLIVGYLQAWVEYRNESKISGGFGN
jgi:hypothetical protein